MIVPQPERLAVVLSEYEAARAAANAAGANATAAIRAKGMTGIALEAARNAVVAAISTLPVEDRVAIFDALSKDPDLKKPKP